MADISDLAWRWPEIGFTNAMNSPKHRHKGVIASLAAAAIAIMALYTAVTTLPATHFAGKPTMVSATGHIDYIHRSLGTA
jgi:hypothetical protein